MYMTFLSKINNTCTLHLAQIFENVDSQLTWINFVDKGKLDLAESWVFIILL